MEKSLVEAVDKSEIAETPSPAQIIEMEVIANVTLSVYLSMWSRIRRYLIIYELLYLGYILTFIIKFRVAGLIYYDVSNTCILKENMKNMHKSIESPEVMYGNKSEAQAEITRIIARLDKYTFNKSELKRCIYFFLQRNKKLRLLNKITGRWVGFFLALSTL